jgi:hypothetical protein
MFGVGGLSGPLLPIEQQDFVAAIHENMHALAQHRRAAGDPGGNELGDRNGQIAEQGRVKRRGVAVPWCFAPFG